MKIDRFNLSDIFEYMSEENSDALLGRLVGCASAGGRLAYWNMLAPRQSPAGLPVRFLEELSGRLHLRDRAFFYKRFVVEEVLGE